MQTNDYENKAQSSTRLSGTVKLWKADRGFGFIRRDDGQPDLFVHIKQVRHDVDELHPGERVTFEPGSDPRNGKPEARDVRLIEE